MITLKLRKSFIQFVLISVCFYFIFKMPNAISLGISKGLDTCLYAILPSLFPFTVLSLYITKIGLFNGESKILSFITSRIFKQPANVFPVIILSLIGGFPIGAKLTYELLSNRQITKNQALRLNLFCMSGGPAFVVLSVGLNMLNSQKAGVIMFASTTLSSIILGIISSLFDDKEMLNSKNCKKNISPSLALSSSITDSINTILSICAWIILFSAVIECLNYINFNGQILLYLKSILEVTGGCVLLAGKVNLPIITALLGFGGLCVHCQVSSYISASGLKYYKFLIFRMLNAILSATICYFILLVVPVEISTSVLNSTTKIVPFSVSASSFFAVLIMCVILVFDIDSKKKVC